MGWLARANAGKSALNHQQMYLNGICVWEGHAVSPAIAPGMKTEVPSGHSIVRPRQTLRKQRYNRPRVPRGVRALPILEPRGLGSLRSLLYTDGNIWIICFPSAV